MNSIQRRLPIGTTVVAVVPPAMAPLAGLTPEQRWSAANQTSDRLALPPPHTLLFLRLCLQDATSSHAAESVAELAAATRLSASTVARALSDLQELDLVVTRRHSGNFVRSVYVPKRIRELVEAGHLEP